jgi:polysaccharide chain length determinant protein (PEP-CTERM system associated)
MQLLSHKTLTPFLGMWRFRWIAFLTIATIACASWVVVWMIPNVYQAKARVYVDSESVLRPLLSGIAVGTDVQTDLTMMSTVLLSRPNLEKVARTTGLAARAEDDPRKFDSLVAALGTQIFLSSDRTGTYTLAYRDNDGQLALRVVETLLRAFQEDTLGYKQEDTTGAQDFLAQQIKVYEDRLRVSEEALADFKRENLGLMPGETGDYYSSVQAVQTNILALRQRTTQLTQRRAEFERQLEGEEPTFGLVDSNPNSGPNDAKIAELKQQLDRLRLQYTDRHPDIVSAAATIERLQSENRAYRASGGSAAGVVDPATGQPRVNINPVYQTIRVGLSQTNAELAEVRGQLIAQESQLAMLRARFNTAPEIEAQLARLSRDYDVNKAQHGALLQRLESARISEQSNQKLSFRVVDPPAVNARSVAPNRFVLFTLALLAGLALAAVFAFALNLIRPVFSTREAVEETLRVRVLGTIARPGAGVDPPWYRTEFAHWGFAMCALFAVYLGNVAVWYFDH